MFSSMEKEDIIEGNVLRKQVGFLSLCDPQYTGGGNEFAISHIFLDR